MNGKNYKANNFYITCINIVQVIFMNKKKKDYLIFTLFFQIFICAIGFGILFGLKTSNSRLIDAYKNEFFNNIEENYKFESVTPLKKEKKKKEEKETDPEVSVKLTEVNSTDASPTETSLNAEITPTGGADYSVTNSDDVPENVSVNGYTLNQKMVLPVVGEITSEFGIRTHPISNELRFHAGIDIAAEMNTPIYAAFDGVVSDASYDNWNGNFLKIEHEGGIMTVYCHCNSLKVKKGDRVTAGQVIATIGSTGSSTGPHLHFEFRIDNKSYDPEIALETAVNVV